MIILQYLELEDKLHKYLRYWTPKLKSTVQIRFYLEGFSEDGYYRSITIKLPYNFGKRFTTRIITKLIIKHLKSCSIIRDLNPITIKKVYDDQWNSPGKITINHDCSLLKDYLIKHFDEFTRGNKYIKLIVDSIIKLN